MSIAPRVRSSGGRYHLSCHNEIFCVTTSSVLEKELIDGHLQVRMTWIDGDRYYPIARVILLNHYFANLGDHLWRHIVPMYRDGNPNNLSLDNLIYKFYNGPLQCDEKPGFYYIPFYPGYVINRAGLTWSLISGNLITATRTAIGEGYYSMRMIDFRGKSRIAFVHRNLCLTFHGYDSDVEDLVINHKDGIKTNNAIENLELVTRTYNREHAIDTGLLEISKPVLSKNRITGEILRHDGVGVACKHFGLNANVSFYVRLIEGDKYPRHDIAFKYDDGTDWPDDRWWDELFNHGSKGKRSVAWREDTGERIEFTGASIGERLTGISRFTIQHKLISRNNTPFNGWCFKYL